MRWRRTARDEVLQTRELITEETLLRYNGMLKSVWDLLDEVRNQSQAVVEAIEACSATSGSPKPMCSGCCKAARPPALSTWAEVAAASCRARRALMPAASRAAEFEQRHRDDPEFT
jgi:hypothetical protein